jgi:hypothetical protein
MNGTRSKYTVWHYVGCGCAVLFVLAVVGIGGCFAVATHWGRKVEREIKDPAAREAKARSLLGYDELPAGYYPGISFSVPFAMDMVILGDRELPAGEEMKHMHDEGDVFRERGFIYFRVRAFGTAEQRFREDTDFDFDPERKLAEGEVGAGGATVSYVADLGTAHVSGGSMRSVSAELEIDCGDGYRRHAVWFTPAPGGETAEEPVALDLAGTPADEATLVEFLDHFRFCG